MKKCVFCDSEKLRSEGGITFKETTIPLSIFGLLILALSIEVEQTNGKYVYLLSAGLWYDDSGGDTKRLCIHQVEINNCPFCGQKLKEEDGIEKAE